MRKTATTILSLLFATSCQAERDDNDGTGDGIATGDPDDGGDTGEGNDDGENGGAGETKFDLGEIPEWPPDDDCGGAGGMVDDQFSYIWIANSAEGSVSKINTRTGIEEGRYWTHPSMRPESSPSRTSVNLMGDVAVSNRERPSTTKIAAHLDRCVDTDLNGQIDTSTGPTDVRPWGEDECVLWHVEFPNVTSGTISGPRPTQWEGGKNSADPCSIDPNPRLWVGYRDDAYTAHFVRLDGNTGATLDDVTYPNWNFSYGPYGGVVNARGDLFANGLSVGAPLIHIDALTLELTDHGNPGVAFYGIGIDADGNPWIATTDAPGKVAVFDDATKQWTVISLASTSVLRGIQIDREGRAWAAANSPCSLVELDVATRTVTNENVTLPGCGTPVGVSIDVDGFVWTPDQTIGSAFKVHPDTKAVELSVPGLVGPYTYSDMTGAGLGLVVNPPG